MNTTLTFSEIYSSSDFSNIFRVFGETKNLAAVLDVYRLKDYIFPMYIQYITKELQSHNLNFVKINNNYVASKIDLNNKYHILETLKTVYSIYYEIKNEKFDAYTLEAKYNTKFNVSDVDDLKRYNEKFAHIEYNDTFFSKIEEYNSSDPLGVKCKLVNMDENSITIDNMLYNYLMFNDIYKDDDLKSNSLFKALDDIKDKNKSEVKILGDYVNISSKNMFDIWKIPELKQFLYYLPVIGMNVTKSYYHKGKVVKPSYSYIIFYNDWMKFKNYMSRPPCCKLQNNEYAQKINVNNNLNSNNGSNVLDGNKCNDNKSDTEDIDENKSSNKSSNVCESKNNLKLDIPKPSSPKDLSHQGCYFIQCAADKNLHKYKIGRGEDVLKRITTERSYQNCKIISVNIVSDHIACEKMVIETFDKLFQKIEKDDEGHYGRETYYISPNKLHYAKHVFDDICDEFF